MTLTTGFSVASESDLRSAIAAIDVGGVDSAVNTDYVILVATDLSLGSDIPTITLASGDTLSVQGDNTDNTDFSAVIDGGGARGFVVNSGTVSLSNLSLTAMTAPGGSGGVPDGGGAIRVGAGASVAVSAVVFSGDRASGGTAAGGAVFVAQGGTFSMLGGSITGSGGSAGGAIFVQGGTITLDATTIGGGISDPSGSELGSGAAAVLAVGAVTLAAGSTYTGGTTIDGVLALDAPGAAGRGALTFAVPTGDTLVVGAGDAPSGPIDGFLPNPGSGAVNSDVIDLQGIGVADAYTLSAGNLLTVTGSAGSASLQLDPLHSYAGDRFVLQSDGGTGTAAGTLVTVVQAGFLVGSETDLNAALAAIDLGGKSAGPGTSYAITFTASFALTSDLFAIDLAVGSSVTIDGAGFTLDGANTYRGFFDYAGGLTLRNLTISDAVASGGAGGGGGIPGGGGAGLGGGLFVAASGTATLSGVTFAHDRAVGGAAGTAGGLSSGGGGGLGGSGGAGGARAGGGGGIGVGASGGSSTGGANGAAGIVLGAAGGHAGTGNRPAGGTGGADGGGGGAGGTVVTSGSGRGGGGSRSYPGLSGSGGVAGFGGGGGGAEGAGFGGGGGAGAAGGWGGGGSGGTIGGFGGGAGAAGGAGGGLGAGGDVFVQDGGALTILSGTLSGGTVAGGAGSNGGAAGAALGSGIFIDGTTGLSLAPAAGQTLRIADVIADGASSGGSGAGRLTIDGAGTVVLSAANRYSGGTTLNAGTLSLQAAGAAGSGAIDFAYGTAGTLVIGVSVVPAVAIGGFLPHDVIDLQKIGIATHATLGAGDVLTISGGAVTVQLTLDPAQNFSGESFAVTSDGSGGTLLTAVDVAGDTPPSVAGTGLVAGDDHAALDPLAGVSVSDLDVGQTETATLRLSAAGNGRLSALSGGLYDAAAGTYTVSGSATAVTAALDALVFTPTINQAAPGQVETTVFNLSVTDGLMVSTAASSTVAITALDDAPTMGGVATGPVEGYWNLPLAPFPAVTVADPDLGAVETATITLADSAQGPNGTTDGNGVLTSSAPGVVLTHTGVGTYTLAAASPAALTTAIRSLNLTAVPHPALPGYTITYVTLAVSDNILPPVTAAVEVLTGLPIFSGLVASQAVTDGSSLRPFGTVAVTDSAGLSIQGLTVTLYDSTSNYTAPTDANGALSGAGLTQVGVGTYTLDPGTPAAVSAELDALVFAPAAGSTATTFFNISASDGATTSDNADTSVIATPGTAPPVITLLPVDGTNRVNAAAALAGFTLAGTTTGVEDGQVVSIAILNAAAVVAQYTATVTGGAWSAAVSATQARALADGTYTVGAFVTNKAGAAAPPAAEAVTVDLSGIVAATPVIAPITVVFGAARVGDPTVARSVVIADSKAAVSDQAALSYTATLAAAGPFGLDATATGLVASGQSASLHLSMSTAAAGSYTGTPVSVALTSTGGGTTGLPDVALSGAKLTLTGQVYAPAVATLSAATLDFGVVHVGDSVSRYLMVGNAAAGALTDVLTGGFGTLSGPFAGPVTLGTGVTAGKSKYLRVDLATQAAGSFIGAASLTLASHDTVLSDANVAAAPVALRAVVDNYAVAAIEKVSGAGVLTQSGTSYRLDFGMVAAGSTALSVSLGVLNAASGLADALGGAFSVGGSTAFANAGLGAFAGLGAGQANAAPTVTLSTATAGTFTETITVRASGSNASGYARPLPVETVTVTGTVTPAPAKAHIAAAALALPPATFLATDVAANPAAPSVTMPDINTLKSTAAGLNGDIVAGYASGDRIDITDLSFAHATLTASHSGANTLVTLASGAARTGFTLSGAFSPAGFHLAADGRAGTVVMHD